MNVFFLLFRFYFNSLKLANIGERPYGVLGTASKFRLREEIEFAPVFTSSKQRRKRKFNVAFVQVVKKSLLHVQNVLFFDYRAGLVWRSRFRRSRVVQNPSVLVKTPAIF